jgi:hypothetical protein
MSLVFLLLLLAGVTTGLILFTSGDGDIDDGPGYPPPEDPEQILGEGTGETPEIVIAPEIPGVPEIPAELPEGPEIAETPEATETPESDVHATTLPRIVLAREDNAELREVHVIVMSEPSGAEIRSRDGEVVGTTPFEGTLASNLDSARLTLHLSGYRSRPIDVNMNQPLSAFNEEFRRRHTRAEPEPETSAPEPEELDPFGRTRTYEDETQEEPEPDPFGGTRRY